MPMPRAKSFALLTSAAILVLIVMAFTGLNAASPALGQPQPAAVINYPNGNFTYSPANVRISVGDSVTWQGPGGPGGDFTAHPLVSDEGLWPVQTTGTTFTFTFTQAGLYHFHCQIHGPMGMVGTVTVLGKERTYLPLARR